MRWIIVGAVWFLSWAVVHDHKITECRKGWEDVAQAPAVWEDCHRRLGSYIFR